MNKPVDVLHLLGTAQVEGMGIAKIVASLAQGVNPHRYRVHAWFLKSDGPLVAELRNAGADARCVMWNKGIRDPMGALRFLRQLRAEEFGIVHQHWGARSIRHLVRFGSKAKIIVHSHGQIVREGDDSPNPVAIRGADDVIAVSRSVAQQIPGQQAHVVYSGIKSSRRAPQTVRSAGVVIGTACRLIEAKGVQDLLSAFATLIKEMPHTRLEIAGAGPEEMKLLKTARNLGVVDSIKFLGWRDDLRQVLGNWDIFVLPSHDEGLPIAILEAMAEGLPVIATNVGGIPELVEHEQTGYLIDPKDVASLRKALHRLIKDPELRNRFGEAGHNRVERDFSVERMVEEMETIYDDLVQR